MVGVIRRLLPFTSIALFLAVVYLGWTFLSRWRANRRADDMAGAERAKANQRIVEIYGNGRLKILAFYASPASLKPGEKGLVCYGVSNAKTVRIEPGIEPVSPSLSRCVAVVGPARDTQYTLSAQDEHGHSEMQSLVLRAR